MRYSVGNNIERENTVNKRKTDESDSDTNKRQRTVTRSKRESSKRESKLEY